MTPISNARWQQFVDAIDGMLGEASDHVAQVGLTYRPESFDVRSATRHPFYARLTSAKVREPPRSLTLDQGFERFTHKRRFFLQTCISLSLGDQFVVESDGGTHGQLHKFEHLR